MALSKQRRDEANTTLTEMEADLKAFRKAIDSMDSLVDEDKVAKAFKHNFNKGYTICTKLEDIVEAMQTSHNQLKTSINDTRKFIKALEAADSSSNAN